MKRKNLQIRILYPARLSFRFDGELKSFLDKQKFKRIQHHQTSFITNAKVNSLGKKQEREKSNLQSEGKVAKSCLTLATPWTIQSMELSRPGY